MSLGALYHVTPRRNVESIAKSGLQPKRGRVYFAKNIGAAMVAGDFWGSDVAVLKIPARHTKNYEIKRNSIPGEYTEYVGKKTIKPDAIEVVGGELSHANFIKAVRSGTINRLAGKLLTRTASTKKKSTGKVKAHRRKGKTVKAHTRKRKT